MSDQILKEYLDNIDEYIKYKRALGYKYGKHEENDLNGMAHLLYAKNPDSIAISKDTVNEYIYSDPDLSSSTISAKESRITLFSKFLSNKGYKDIFIYPYHQTKVTTDFAPYIFSKDEISLIFKATDQMPNYHFDMNNRLFYQVFIRLLYSTGIRLSEAINLKVSDVDLKSHILKIYDGKGRSSRFVPYSDSMSSWMNKWADQVLTLKSVYFFETAKGTKRNRSTIYIHFEKDILKLAGIHRNVKNTGPRLHDLRHTFACHCLSKMEDEGKDVYSTLPYLSVYMGHVDIKSTETYLRLSQHEFDRITENNHWIFAESVGDINED